MKRKCVLICMGLLVLVQTGSYFLMASVKIPLLALRLTAEAYLYPKGPPFSWVAVRVGDSANLTAKQQELLVSRFRQRYSTVYTNLANVPSDLVMRDGNGRMMGLKDGFSFSFGLASSGPFWVRLRSSNYLGELSYSSREHVYVWILGTWVKLYDRLRYQS